MAGGRTAEETVGRRRSTTIIYQFRILMSERLIQKASTLRKPKRSPLSPPPPRFLEGGSRALLPFPSLPGFCFSLRTPFPSRMIPD